MLAWKFKVADSVNGFSVSNADKEIRCLFGCSSFSKIDIILWNKRSHCPQPAYDNVYNSKLLGVDE